MEAFLCHGSVPLGMDVFRLDGGNVSLVAGNRGVFGVSGVLGTFWATLEWKWA